MHAENLALSYALGRRNPVSTRSRDHHQETMGRYLTNGGAQIEGWGRRRLTGRGKHSIRDNTALASLGRMNISVIRYVY